MDIRIRKIKNGVSASAAIKFTRKRKIMHALQTPEHPDLWALIHPGSAFALMTFKGDKTEAYRVLTRFFFLQSTGMTASDIRSKLIDETRI